MPHPLVLWLVLMAPSVGAVVMCRALLPRPRPACVAGGAGVWKKRASAAAFHRSPKV